MPEKQTTTKADNSEPRFSYEEGWREFLESLEEDPWRAEILARFILSVDEALEEGKIKHARATLKSALRRTFPYSNEFEADFEKWLLTLRGE